MNYAELQCASHFSFLRGASSCEELFSQAAVCGLDALAITDRNSLAGIVRAHVAAKVTGVRLIVGCRLVLTDGSEVLVYLMGRAEANERLLPLAARHADQTANNRRNARKPRRRGEETREAAMSVIAQNETISKRRCAERVAEIRELTDIRSIEQRISEYFEKLLTCP